MKSRAKLFGSCILIFLFLLMSASSTPVSNARWVIETIDAPMYFDNLSNSMLQFFDGKPTMVFGGDHLYLRYWNYVTLDWTIETIDPSLGVGSYASLFRDAYGHTFISYYDAINQVLKFATPSDNILFPGWDVETIDPTPNSGIGNAISATVGGQPQISYTTHTASTYRIKYVKRTCTGSFPHVVCSWSAPEEVVAAIYDGAGTSIAIASDGTPHISYVTASFILKHAYRIGGGAGNCGDGNNWQCETVPGQTGTVGLPTSIALYNDYPRIAFHDASKGLSFAYQDAGGWHLSLPRGGTDMYGSGLSLVLDGSGIPHISYLASSNAVWHAWGSTTGGGTWTNEAVPGATSAQQTAIAFDTVPCILYYEYFNGSLKYTCKPSGWDAPEEVADAGQVGQYSSLALSADGEPHIGYVDDLSYPASPLQANWSDATQGCNDPNTAIPWQCVILNDSTTGYGSGFLPSVAINPTNGDPAVSYQGRNAGFTTLEYAWYVGSGGTCPGNPAWSCTAIDSISGTQNTFASSLAFVSSGPVSNPRIAYKTYDGKLKIAIYQPMNTDPCPENNTWVCEVIDSGLGTSSGRPSMRVASGNVPVISYTDYTSGHLKLAMLVTSGGTGCIGSDISGKWSCSEIADIPGYGNIDSSLVLATDSQALISFAPGSLKLATVGLPAGSPTIEVVDAVNGNGTNSLDLYQGTAWIAYTDSNLMHALRLAHRVGAGNGNCGDDSAWQSEVLDSDVSVGLYPSLRINSAGMAYISYFDDTNKDLKLAYTRLFGFLPILQKP